MTRQVTKEMGFLVGAGEVDITPELGIQLAGHIARYRPAEEIHERLYARALVLESGTTRLCLLSLDLLAASNEWAGRVRSEAADRFGLSSDAIMFHVTQNHAAPSLGHFFDCPGFPSDLPWLRGGDDRYNAPTVEKILRAIDRAIRDLQPVTMHAGRGINGSVAFNRRFVMRDGTAQCHPPCCDPRILHVEGPADPEVGVMTWTRADGAAKAMLLHHTCHPTAGFSHPYVIGDWPGAWAEMMRAHGGDACVPLVVNGCCGNICPYNHIDPHHATDHRKMARMLSETAIGVLERMETQDSATLAMERTVLSLPLRPLTDAEVDAARQFLDAHPEPKWMDEERTLVDQEWVYAVTILELKDTQARNPYCDYEIQVFRIGETALVALMGEPFVEAQLRIKLASPAAYTFVAHFCNGYAGYIPTPDALGRGGLECRTFECRTALGSKFQPDALDRIGDAALALLAKLFLNARGAARHILPARGYPCI